MRDRPVTLTLSISAVLVVASAAANDFSLGWWTIDGGGDMWTTGGEFELSGTIGQPDAGAVLIGGDFELTGGFWTDTPGSGVPGDCDADGLVDFDDFAVLANCMAGPAVYVPPECRCVDFDEDGDLDLADFARFQPPFTGE